MPSSSVIKQQQVPVLDVSQAFDPVTRPRLVAELKNALLNVGFFYVSNVPIDNYSSVLEDVKRETNRFFNDLSLEDKLAIEMKNSPHFLGYNRFGNEITSDKVDLREQVDLATELPAPPKSTLTDINEVWRNMEGPNQWPNVEVLPEFRPVIEGYIDKMSTFSRWFVELVEEALDVPHGTFNRYFKEHQQAKLKLIRYPEIEAPQISSLSGSTAAAKAVPVDASQGVGPHRDQSFITYIYQATPHVSLQIQDQFNSGEWIDVPPIPDTLVVAVGQTLEYITKEVCTATIHRVVTPEHGLGDRLSIPFFQNIDNDCIKSQLNLPEALLKLRDERNAARKGEQIGFQFRAADDETKEAKPIGWTNFLNRIKSHRDVAQKWYPELLEYVLQQLAA